MSKSSYPPPPSRPTIALIAAVDKNGVIGRRGDLPWHLPKDLQHFMRSTKGKPVIMGRKTWESFEGPLPRRKNIVMTRQPGYEAEGAVVVATLSEAFEEAGGAEEVMIAGGEGVYGAALPLADRLYLTHVDVEVEGGDTRFPEVDLTGFKVVEEREFPADEDHEHPFRIVIYQRKRKKR